MKQSERIQLLCSTNNISIGTLERELSFSQGYIKKVKGSFPADRLDQIAVFFDVSIYYLIYGDDRATVIKNFKTLKKLREEKSS